MGDFIRDFFVWLTQFGVLCVAGLGALAVLRQWLRARRANSRLDVDE
jgi:predicted MFS family arabinose efflux permease